ncbi:MAG TPA: serine/threonine-protein kinase [Streptosporangiaceae bacterium]|nr:serine/threonine-protein kinase [Streptosporangiaceae bacterium]
MTSQDSASDFGGIPVGSRVGKYLIEEQIGRGGMAAVYRARDSELGRVVALKILAPALAADDGFRQRFVRESRVAASVDDPHIIPLYEAGQDGSVLFIAMRYVSGGDVRSLLFRQGSLTPEQAAAIVSQVASALDAAHAAGLVHRDVKPANMLLDSAPGRSDHVYLSDFGLSKEAAGSIGLTGTGLFLGTVDYAAPEQIDGRPVDGRTDQYALGCATFEMLIGAPPFRRDHGMAVLAAHMSQPPPSLAAARPELPPGLDTVFAKVLAKSPDDRYRSCGEFADALRQVLGLGRYDYGPPRPARQQTELAWNAYGPAAASGGPAAASGGAPTSAPGFATAGQGAAGYPEAGQASGQAPSHIVPGFGSQPSYPPPAAWAYSAPSGPVQPVQQQRSGSARWPIAVASGAVAAAVVAAAIIVAARLGSSSSTSDVGAGGTQTVTVTQSASSAPSSGPTANGVPTPINTSVISPAVVPPPTVTAPATSPANTQPTWTKVEQPGEFSIDLPSDWMQVANRYAGDRVTFADSAGFQVIVDWTPWQLSPVAHQRQLSRQTLDAHGSSYQEISIQSAQYRDYSTADWQFTDYQNGVQIESIDRAFIVDSGSTYAIELYGPIGQFQSVQASIWSKMLASFEPES